MILPIVLYGCENLCHIEGGIYIEGVGELGAEEDIWASEGQGNRRVEKTTLRSFMICNHQTLFGRSIKENEMGRACGMLRPSHVSSHSPSSGSLHKCD